MKIKQLYGFDMVSSSPTLSTDLKIGLLWKTVWLDIDTILGGTIWFLLKFSTERQTLNLNENFAFQTNEIFRVNENFLDNLTWT